MYCQYHSSLPTVLLLTLALNCTPSARPTHESTTIDHQSLGIRVVDLSDPWSVVAQDSDQWILSDGSQGTLTLVNGEDDVINIEQAARNKLAEFDALDGGESFGNRQLKAPIGLIYTARGRYPDTERNSVGELWGYTVHPKGGRLLVIRYAYPGNSDANLRGHNLLTLLESLELATEPS